MKNRSSLLRAGFASVLALASLATIASEASADTSFTAFESGQVRPLALSPDGKLLYAVNTPDNRLEIFRVKQNGLEHRGSVSVGMEPVAVAVHGADEVWVVNHLSDSVSVVDVDADGASARVVRTILVGDEPRDIVFAGPGKDRAFVTTAHRGQNSPIDPQLTTPGVGRADVWVLDANPPANAPANAPLTIVTLFADTPRALAVSPDGGRVYAAAFHSGNRTTVITDSILHPTIFGPVDIGARQLPGPTTNWQGIPAPGTGLIVRHNGSHWVDENGTAWDDKVRFSLPDKDVFVINANANPPVETASPFQSVGTILYNMAVNPATGKVYVSNTEALNEKRFEGPGIYAGHSVRGHFAENRITVLGQNGSVAPRHLNKHVNYASCCAPTPNAESQLSLALPTGMVVSEDGKKLFVAAMGSSKVGVFDTAKLENDTFQPSAASQIAVSGGGPTGLVLDKQGKRLFVMTRFDNAISIVDTASKAEIGHVAMHTPEPPSIVAGRRFLYDAGLSAHGDSACASCHVFGDTDDLAWDLGNPDDSVVDDPGPWAPALPGFQDPATGLPIFIPTGEVFAQPKLHPMKGPMATQSLRGMANQGPMHWRGDRTAGLDEPSAPPDQGAFNEHAAFVKFQAGFINLLGTNGPIPDADMKAFADFILQVTYPPNPIRHLDSSLTPDQAAGLDLFQHGSVGDLFTGTNGHCASCHTYEPQSNIGPDAPGFFGTSGKSGFDFLPQFFKIAHVRNMYQKVGMFGMAEDYYFYPGDNQFMGDQIRGFGFSHDASIDTLYRFHNRIAFGPPVSSIFPQTPEGAQKKRQVEAFLLAADSNEAPIVGQQVTARKHHVWEAAPRVQLLRDRAEAGECELVAKVFVTGREAGFLYLNNGTYAADVDGVPNLPAPFVQGLANLTDVTYTCVPLGSGARAGIDRDNDGVLDGDE
ncbi:MAG: beta-propeller fold lactonase family protein [Polyangiaceae bacterium]